MIRSSLVLAAVMAAASASADSGDVRCASATSHWSAPISLSRDELQASHAPAFSLGTFHVVIDAGPGLAANAAALAAWERAAGEWEAIIGDPVTVTVEADLVRISEPGVLGQTDPVRRVVNIGDIRDAMAMSALTEADDAVTAALPTAAQLSFLLSPGTIFSGMMVATKANLKALGFTGLDAQLGAPDATINFNSQFSFDFDRSNGTTPGTIDFETVAAHELGHALGFISGVDTADNGIPLVAPTPLDLFRFPNGTADDPTSTADFTAARRSLRPGSPDVFDDLSTEYAFSTGASVGDGRQASHWKDDQLTGVYIGMMDPTLSSRVTLPMTEADARSMDVIGWDVVANVTTTSSTTSTTLPPECFEDATCADADPCTRDLCNFPRCLHGPIDRPADVQVLVPVVASLDACLAGKVPASLEKRARQLRNVLGRAERAKSAARLQTLLDRSSKRIDHVLTKATALEDGGKLGAECADALSTRMDEVRGALECLRGAS